MVVQRLRGARWLPVARLALGSKGGATLPPSLRALLIRVSVPAAPGYLAATSTPRRVP